MNYLVSVLNLYINKESNNYLIMELDNMGEFIKISLSYSNSYNNKTYIKLKNNVFFKDIDLFAKSIQGNLTVKNESIDNNIYSITFNNNRLVKFSNFNSNDIELIRSNLNLKNYETLYNLNLESVEDKSYNEIYKENKNVNSNLKLSFGFTGFMTIFLTSIWFLDIFMIALWIFKVLK